MIIITDGGSNDEVQTMSQAKEAKDASKTLKTTILKFYDVFEIYREYVLCYI